MEGAQKIISTQVIPMMGFALFIGMRNGLFGNRVVQLPTNARSITLDEGFLWSQIKWYTEGKEGSLTMGSWNYVTSVFPIRVDPNKD